MVNDAAQLLLTLSCQSYTPERRCRVLCMSECHWKCGWPVCAYTFLADRRVFPPLALVEVATRWLHSLLRSCLSLVQTIFELSIVYHC